jgi:hypothetical protein
MFSYRLAVISWHQKEPANNDLCFVDGREGPPVAGVGGYIDTECVLGFCVPSRMQEMVIEACCEGAMHDGVVQT